jgi:alpha-glucosidase
VMLALPGAVFIYNGEELGLANVDLPDEALRDPVWERSGHTRRGRDASRVPVPWAGDTPPFGFSTNSDTWLPFPNEWSSLTVEKQLADPGSTLSFYREAIGLRGARAEFGGTVIEWLDSPDDALVYRVVDGGLVCALNAGDTPLSLPAGEVLLASADLVDGELPPNAAAWVVSFSSRAGPTRQ